MLRESDVEEGETYLLIRGDFTLGSVMVQDALCDFPWYGGRFEAKPAFAAAADLFRAELRLLEEDSMEPWEAVWAQIEEPGLKLVPEDGGEAIFNLIIHIEGATARWRF